MQRIVDDVCAADVSLRALLELSVQYRSPKKPYRPHSLGNSALAPK
jgi:hypothetical protein